MADGGLFACGHVDAEVGETPEVAGESLADEPVGFQNGGTGGVVVGANRYRGFPCGSKWGKVVGKIAGGEVGADGHHAAANVAADGCGGYCVAHGNDAANGDGGAHMHVGHNGHPVGPGQVGDRPDLALCRMIDVDEWRPNAGGRVGTREGFGQAEGMMHDETPCVRTTRLMRAPPAGVGRASGVVGRPITRESPYMSTCYCRSSARRMQLGGISAAPPPRVRLRQPGCRP